MAHFIREDLCICCGVCVSECPNGAISYDIDEGAKFPKIIKEKCDDCGACAEICPPMAIVDPPLSDMAYEGLPV